MVSIRYQKYGSCNFSLVFLTTYDKVYMPLPGWAGPVFRHDPLPGFEPTTFRLQDRHPTARPPFVVSIRLNRWFPC